MTRMNVFVKARYTTILGTAVQSGDLILIVGYGYQEETEFLTNKIVCKYWIEPLTEMCYWGINLRTQELVPVNLHYCDKIG